MATRNIRAVEHRRLFAYQHAQFAQLIGQRARIAEVHQEYVSGIGLAGIRHDRGQQQLAGLRAVATHVQRADQRRFRYFRQHQLQALVELVEVRDLLFRQQIVGARRQLIFVEGRVTVHQIAWEHGDNLDVVAGVDKMGHLVQHEGLRGDRETHGEKSQFHSITPIR